MKRTSRHFAGALPGEETTVSFTGVGGAGAVVGHHCPRPPPGQAHQIHCGATLGKPLVGEGMAELVGLR
jgi:hypothetical protein